MNQNKLKLDNSVSTIVINLEGGSYIDFRLKTNPVNPLNWHYNGDDGLDFEGHFICLDRWGPPSVGEAANGFKHHGEASSIMWDVL